MCTSGSGCTSGILSRFALTNHITFTCVVLTDPSMVPRYHGPESSRSVRQEEERKEGKERQKVRQEEEEINKNKV